MISHFAFVQYRFDDEGYGLLHSEDRVTSAA
jgi:hypothetical protein